MKKPRKKKISPKKDLSTENELLKLKMMAEFGGNFMGSDEIPADVENKFLKQISRFHKMQENATMVPVYKFIGEPEYNHVNDLSETEIKRELKKLLKLLHKNQVVVEVLSEITPKEFYRFITEELFKQQVQDIKIKGWMTQFIYEDFHPNDNYDVQACTRDINSIIFNKGSMFFEPLFSEEMLDHIGLSADREDFQHTVTNFWNKHNNVKLQEYEIVSITFADDKTSARVITDVTYKTQAQKGRRYKTEDTRIEYLFEKDKYVNGVWGLKQVISTIL